MLARRLSCDVGGGLLRWLRPPVSRAGMVIAVPLEMGYHFAVWQGERKSSRVTCGS
jgi:hypothetical protein